MRRRLASCLVLLALGGGAEAAEPACDVAPIKANPELTDLLTRRAIKVIEMASAPGWKSDEGLAQRVAPDAPFMLGEGDLGNTLGAGPEGARLFVEALKPDQYRYEGWDYMMVPVEAPCAEQKITVDLINAKQRIHSSAVFTFVNGRVTAVDGWRRSYETGKLPPVR